MRLILFIIPILLLSFSCTKKKITLYKDSDEVVKLDNWKIIGPMHFDTLSTDERFVDTIQDLRAYGIDENNFTNYDLEVLEEKGLVKDYEEYDGFVDIIWSLLGTDSLIRDMSNAYLVGEVYCKKAMDYVMSIDYSSSCKIWLNGELQVVGDRKNSMIKKCDRFVPVKLKKGKNQIFIKLSRGGNKVYWRIFLRFMNEQKAKELYTVNFLKDFVVNPNIQDSLGIYPGPFNEYNFTVLSHNTKDRYSKSDFEELSTLYRESYFNTSELEDGFYTVSLILDKSDTLKEVIYKGDVLALEEELKSKYDKLPESKAKNDVKPGVVRLRYVLEVIYDSLSTYQTKFYYKNVVFYANILDIMIQNTSSEQFTYSNSSGTFLRTYYSNLDSLEHYFAFHGSHSKADSTFSLVFVVPFKDWSANLVQSWYISILEQFQMDNQLAENAGYTIAYPFFRGKQYDINKGIEEFDIVKNELESLYNKKIDKIYLLGDCEGALRALHLAQFKGNEIDGMALFMPSFSEQYNFRKLKQVPTYIYLSEDDKGYDTSKFEKFMKQAKENGMSVTVEAHDGGHEPYRKDYRKHGFEFFQNL
jgi:hypothetical protein